MINIQKQAVMPSGVSAAFHKVVDISILPSNQIRLIVESWVDSIRHAEGDQSVSRVAVSIPLDSLVNGQELLDELTQRLTAEGPLQGGQVVAPQTTDIDDARAWARKAINAWRRQANAAGFEFNGKHIAYDEEISRWDIAGVNDEVALTGELPVDFPLAWKATDETYVPIPDVGTWRSFVRARVAQGAANFARSQALKAYVMAEERTVEDILAVRWDSDVA